MQFFKIKNLSEWELFETNQPHEIKGSGARIRFNTDGPVAVWVGPPDGDPVLVAHTSGLFAIDVGIPAPFAVTVVAPLDVKVFANGMFQKKQIRTAPGARSFTRPAPRDNRDPAMIAVMRQNAELTARMNAVLATVEHQQAAQVKPKVAPVAESAAEPEVKQDGTSAD